MVTVMVDDDAEGSAQNNSLQGTDDLTDSDMSSMAAAMRLAGLGSMLEETPVAIEEAVEVSSQQLMYTLLSVIRGGRDRL